jgi:hypothetical protein
MDVLGHNHITNDDESIALAHLLQHRQEEVTAARVAEQWLSAITTASNEMEVPAAIVTLEIAPHGYRVATQRRGGGDAGHGPTLMKTIETGGRLIPLRRPLLEKREKWRTQFG